MSATTETTGEVSVAPGAPQTRRALMIALVVVAAVLVIAVAVYLGTTAFADPMTGT